MGGNGPNGILVRVPKLVSQPGCLAEQGNEMIGDVGFADPFSSVLKQVLREFSRFAVLEQGLISGSNGFPGEDRLCCVLRDGGPKTSTIFVTWNVQVPQMLCLFKLDSLFINHLWCPLAAHTVKR